MTIETTAPARGVEPLLEVIDRAVRQERVEDITRMVQEGLTRLITNGTLTLPPELRRPAEGHYARRLVHRSEELGYVVVAMIWGVGQGTPLHDHSGAWCVEGVLDGRIAVTQYELLERRDDRCRFDRKQTVEAEVGSAGCLIPPFEYHTIENAVDEPSITLHIYGRDLLSCGVFEPCDDGTWCERQKALSYDA